MKGLCLPELPSTVCQKSWDLASHNVVHTFFSFCNFAKKVYLFRCQKSLHKRESVKCAQRSCAVQSKTRPCGVCYDFQGQGFTRDRWRENRRPKAQHSPPHRA